MPRDTFVYHAGSHQIVSKRLVRVERELQQMRRERATLVGYFALFGAAAILGGFLASYVLPAAQSAIAYTISTPHYR